MNREITEWKGTAVSLLGIDNYDEPFNDFGIKCKEAWEEGDLILAIKHNRSCSLKERDILLRRGYRKPDDLELVSNILHACIAGTRSIRIY